MESWTVAWEWCCATVPSSRIVLSLASSPSSPFPPHKVVLKWQVTLIGTVSRFMSDTEGWMELADLYIDQNE